MLKRKDILGIRDLSAEEIVEILDRADDMRALTDGGERKSRSLEGRTLVTLFYENSTRTRVSFELAGKYLSATVSNIASGSSSVQKGESLSDTGKTLDAMGTDFIAVRHPISGAPAYLAKNVRASVINAGDGTDEHPTQALLDMLTLRRKFSRIEGLKVAIVGDIKHSRVARSDIYGLTKMGACVSVYAPGPMMPMGIEMTGAKKAGSLEEAVSGANAVMGLRIQLERQCGDIFPSTGEYARYYGLNDGVMKYAADDAIVLHPGPVNRGVEISPALRDGGRSYIDEQVTNGIAVRMALLSLLDEYRRTV